MDEEIKSNAIELSDEELDKVAGGRAVIYLNLSQKTHLCNRTGIKASELYDNLFKKFTCDRCDAKDETKPKSCDNCIYHTDWGLYERRKS